MYILYVQEVVTHLYRNLLHKMDNYFLDIQQQNVGKHGDMYIFSWILCVKEVSSILIQKVALVCSRSLVRFYIASCYCVFKKSCPSLYTELLLCVQEVLSIFIQRLATVCSKSPVHLYIASCYCVFKRSCPSLYSELLMCIQEVLFIFIQ